MASLVPPRAAIHPTERLHHGDRVVDDYEWLRDKESDEVLTHLTAENAYTEQENAHLDGLRQQIFGEIKDRTGATIRCLPLHAPAEDGRCVVDGRPSASRVLFARAY